jgi:hypothetical protein
LLLREPIALCSALLSLSSGSLMMVNRSLIVFVSEGVIVARWAISFTHFNLAILTSNVGIIMFLPDSELISVGPSLPRC